MNVSCAQQAQLAAVLSAVFLAINITTVVSFYGWRRARAPWRAVLFTVFVVCGLFVVDVFLFAVVPQPVAGNAPVCK